MIVFYSDHCPFCRSLLEEIKRRDVQKVIKLKSIDALKANNSPLVSKISSVPALLLFLNNKNTEYNILFGKAVFDTLIAPRGGILNGGGGGGTNANATATTSSSINNSGLIIGETDGGGSKDCGDPEPFAFDILGGKSAICSRFSEISDKNEDMTGTAASAIGPPLGQMGQPMGPPQMGIALGPSVTPTFQDKPSGRVESSLPDLDKLMMQRTNDVMRYTNTTALLPPVAGR